MFVNLFCAVLCHIVSLQYLSMQVVSPPLDWLPSSYFLVVWSPTGAIRYDWCALPRNTYFFSHIADYVYDIYLLYDPDVGISILVCDVEHASFHLSCACLVSVQVSAPYVIADSTHELYTCLFRHSRRKGSFRRDSDVWPEMSLLRSPYVDLYIFLELIHHLYPLIDIIGWRVSWIYSNLGIGVCFLYFHISKQTDPSCTDMLERELETKP